MANRCIVFKAYPKLANVKSSLNLSKDWFELECYKIMLEYNVTPNLDIFEDFLEAKLHLKFSNVKISDKDIFQKLNSAYNNLLERIENEDEDLSLFEAQSQIGVFNAFMYEDADGNQKLFIRKPEYDMSNNDIISDAILYNNGFELSKAANGKPSKLYKALLDYFDGNAIKAAEAKAVIYTKEFQDWFFNDNNKDFLDENGEPILHIENGRAVYKRNSGDNINDQKSAEGNPISFRNNHNEILLNPTKTLEEGLLNTPFFSKDENDNIVLNIDCPEKKDAINFINSFSNVNNLPQGKLVVYKDKDKYCISINRVTESDVIERSDNNQNIDKIANFLKQRFPLINIKYITEDEAKQLLGNLYSDNIKSFTQGLNSYFIKGKVTEETSIEECLHPFVNTLKNTNQELFNELLEEAQKSFPKLKDLIDENYLGEFASDKDQELVCQALARYFKKEFTENTTQSFLDVCLKFFEWIKNLFKKLFGKYQITAKDLKKLTLKDLAKLINTSDTEFLVDESNKLFFLKNNYENLHKYKLTDNLYVLYKIDGHKIKLVSSKKYLSRILGYVKNNFNTRNPYGTLLSKILKEKNITNTYVSDIDDNSNVEIVDENKLAELSERISLLESALNNNNNSIDSNSEIAKYTVVREQTQTGYDRFKILWTDLGTNKEMFVNIKHTDSFGDTTENHSVGWYNRKEKKFNVISGDKELTFRIIAAFQSQEGTDFNSSNDALYRLKVNIDGRLQTIVVKNPEIHDLTPICYDENLQRIDNNKIDANILKQAFITLVKNKPRSSTKIQSINESSFAYGLIQSRLRALKESFKRNNVSINNQHVYEYGDNKTTRNTVSSLYKNEDIKENKSALLHGNQVDEMLRIIFNEFTETASFSLNNISINNTTFFDAIYEKLKPFAAEMTLGLKIYNAKVDDKDEITNNIENNIRAFILHCFNWAKEFKETYELEYVGFFTELMPMVSLINGKTVGGTPDMIIYGQTKEKKEYCAVCDFKTSLLMITEATVVSRHYPQLVTYYGEMISKNSDGGIKINDRFVFPVKLNYPQNLQKIGINESNKYFEIIPNNIESINIDNISKENFDKSQLEEVVAFQTIVDMYKSIMDTNEENVQSQVENNINELQQLDLQEQESKSLERFNLLAKALIGSNIVKEEIDYIHDSNQIDPKSKRDVIKYILLTFSNVISDAIRIDMPGEDDINLNRLCIFYDLTFRDKVMNYYQRMEEDDSLMDPQSMTRIEFIQYVLGDESLQDGVYEILEFIKELFNPEGTRVLNLLTGNVAEQTKLLDKYKFIYNHFNDFIKDAAPKIREIEGINIKEGVATKYNNNDEEDNHIEQLEDNTHEAWNTKEVSTYNSLSIDVRNALEHIYYVDQDGDPISLNEFELPSTIGGRTIVALLLNWCYNCETLSEMIDVLKQKRKAFPYVYQILGLLGYYIENNEIKEYDEDYLTGQHFNFRNQFFSNFKKDLTEYSVIIQSENQDGEIEFNVHFINASESSIDIKNNVEASFMEHTIPFIKSQTVNSITVETIDINLFLLLTNEINKFLDSSSNGILKDRRLLDDDVLNKNVEKINTIISFFNKFGIQINQDTVKAIVINSGAQKNNDLKVLRDRLLGILRSFQDLNDLGFLSANPFEKNLDESKQVIDAKKSIVSSYTKISNVLSKYIVLNVESMAREGDKNYLTFAVPGFIGEMMNHFNGSLDRKSCQEYIIKAYGSKKSFLCNGVKRNHDGSLFFDSYNKTYNGSYRCYYINELFNNYDHMSNILQLKQLVGLRPMNKDLIEYMKMDDITYTRTLFEMYKSGIQGTFYAPVPIMADKPVSDFIQVPKITENLKSLNYDVFVQELDRIANVIDRASSNKSTLKKDANRPGFIKSYDISEKDLELIDKFDRDSIFSKLKQAKKPHGAQFFFFKEINNIIFADSRSIKDDDEKALKALIIEYLKHPLSKVSKELFFRIYDKIMNIRTYNFYGKLATTGALNMAQKYFNINDLSIWLSEENDFKTLENNKDLKDYIEQVSFSNSQLIQLMVTDPAFYQNTEDFLKRFALVHAPALKLNKEAEAYCYQLLEDNTSDLLRMKLSDGFIRSLIVKDEEIISDSINEIMNIFKSKEVSGELNETQRIKMKSILKDIEKVYKEVNVADGQSYSCPTSVRKKLSMAGKWNRKEEIAYRNIINGAWSIEDIEVVMNAIKPFLFGKELKPSYTGKNSFEEIPVPIQLKNSEYLLFVVGALLRSKSGNKEYNKLLAIEDFMELTHYKGRKIARKLNGKWFAISLDYKTGEIIKTALRGNKFTDGLVLSIGSYKNNGIDTVSFESTIKSGLYSTVDISTTDDYLSTMENLALNAISNGLYNPRYVNTVDFAGYGIQQEVPAHELDHELLMGSQSKILAMTDFNPNSNIEWYNPVDPSRPFSATFGGVHSSEENSQYGFIRQYEQLIADNITDSYNQLMDLIANKNDDENTRKQKLSKLLLDAMEGDSKYTYDMKYAVRLYVDENGNYLFNVPLQDPSQSTRIQSLFNSIIKSRIHKQTIKGGPVVQTSNFGTSDDLKPVFDKNGHFKYYEIYITPLDSDLMRRITFTKDLTITYRNNEGKEVSEFYKKGEFMPVNYALQKKVINEEELKTIAYRIPTEDKYSMLPCRIKGFIQRASGEAVMFPKEVTAITGSDFDIDKMYMMFKSFDKNNKEIDNINSKDFHTRKTSRDNKIFNMMYAALTHPETREKMFNPGGFNQLKKTARITNILNNFKYLPKEIQDQIFVGGKINYSFFDNKDFADLEKIMSLSLQSSITDPSTQIYLHKQNSVAKTLVGIFANHNIAHAFFSLEKDFGFKIPEKMLFTFGGKSFLEGETYRLDPVKDFNDQYISKNTGSLLAASVDAVKDPCLSFMNINETTVNVCMLLIRLGFDQENIGLFLSHPVILRIVNKYQSESSGKFVGMDFLILNEIEAIDRKLSAFSKKSTKEKNSLGEANFTTEELAEKIILFNQNSGSEESLMYSKKLLENFGQLYKYTDSFRSLTSLTKFNSISSAAGPGISDTIKTVRDMNRFFRENEIYVNANEDFFEHHPILKSLRDKIFGSVTNNQIEQNGAAFEIFGDDFILTSPAFTEILDRFEELLDLREGLKIPFNAKEINSIANDLQMYLMTYKLNGLLSFIQQYDYLYLMSLQFISDFQELKTMYPKNKLLQVINIRNVRMNINGKSVNKLVLYTDISKANDDKLDDLRSAWEEINSSSNIRLKNLSTNLFKYNILRSSFTFSPKTFLHIAPAQIKRLLKNYNETLLQIAYDFKHNKNVIEKYNINSFIKLYIRNHPDFKKIVRKVSLRGLREMFSNVELRSKDDLPNELIMITNSKPPIDIIGPFILVNNILYKHIVDTFDDKFGQHVAGYGIVSLLGSKNNFFEYDMYGGDSMLSKIPEVQSLLLSVFLNTPKAFYSEVETDFDKIKLINDIYGNNEEVKNLIDNFIKISSISRNSIDYRNTAIEQIIRDFRAMTENILNKNYSESENDILSRTSNIINYVNNMIKSLCV